MASHLFDTKVDIPVPLKKDRSFLTLKPTAAYKRNSAHEQSQCLDQFLFIAWFKTINQR